MKKEELAKRVKEEYDQIIQEVADIPDDLTAVKKLLIEVVSTNRVILEKLNDFVG